MIDVKHLKSDKSEKVTTDNPNPYTVLDIVNSPGLKCELKRPAESSAFETNSIVITYPRTQEAPTRPERRKKNQPAPKLITTPPDPQELIQCEDGAAGLWAKNDVKMESLKKQEPKVEAPKVTAADWEIFKQFMDPLPKVPIKEKLVEKRNMPEQELVKNRDEFVCSICELFILKGMGVVLRSCGHNFCRLCLIDTINKNHDAMGEVKCPFPVANCKSLLHDEEVKLLLGDNYQKFALKILQTLNNAVRHKERNEEAARHNADLQAIDNLEFIENVEAFECAICFCDIEVGQGVILKNCRHSFCKDCLIESIKHSEDYIVKCPGDDCELTIQEREVRGIVPAEIFDKHLEKSLKLYEGTSTNAYHCKTPDCRGFIEMAENLLGFMCFVCKKVNCISCKVIHHGKNCEEYQDTVNPDGKHQRENDQSEKAIRKMIEDGEAMFCPQCGIPVIKQDGCDFISCTTCKLGICWVTKKPRMPLKKANGTIIDGCHCREFGGVMCHPSCKFCH